MELELLLTPRLARLKHVQTDARHDGCHPGGDVLDVTGIRATEADPALLHGVLRFAERAKHAVRDRAQVAALLLEALGQPLIFSHCPYGVLTESDRSGAPSVTTRVSIVRTRRPRAT